MTRTRVEILGWVVLGAALLATLAGAFLAKPRVLEGEEPTYVLQASSVAGDFDLAYTEEDYRRFREGWGERPGGLDLDSRDGGKTQVYRKPFPYALVAAPFAALSPVRGLWIANALLLAVAALAAARTLLRHLGETAPLAVAAFVFASIAFAWVFRSTADVFLLAMVALGFALIYGDRGREDTLPQVYEGPRSWSWALFARWAAAGALLAIPAAYRLPYLFLLLPAIAAARSLPARFRRPALVGLEAGVLALLAATMLVHQTAGGEALWSLRGLGLQLDPVLFGWNALYLLVGRHVGVLPYFLPLLLGLLAFRGERGRWALLGGVGLAALAFLLTSPFGFYGGGAPLGNQVFLPLYGALWFLPARPIRAMAVIAVALWAGVFLLPSWLAAGASQRVASAVRGWLPYETTQRDMPGEEVSEEGLRLKLLNPWVWKAERGRGLRVAGDAPAEILVASRERLETVALDFDRSAPTRLLVNRGELRPSVLRPDGSITFEVPLGGGRVHPMWWTGDDYHLYELEFRLPGAASTPVGFRVRAARDLIEKSGR